MAAEMESGSTVAGYRKKSDVLEFNIESVSDEINDCRLKIVPADGGKVQWYRERILSGDDEIIDRLIDAKTGQVIWSSHRPIRGWYLNLRSPLLPQGAAVPLQPATSTQVGSTPLSLTLGTRLDRHVLDMVDGYISRPQQPTGEDAAASSHIPTLEDDRECFNAVPLEKDDRRMSHARTSSRNLTQGHVRHRSAGIGSTQPPSRNVSKASQTESILEESGEGKPETARAMKNAHLSAEEGHTSDNKPSDNFKPGEAHSNPDLYPPQTCHFLLTDEVQIRNPETKISLARWAWSALSQSLRPPLRFDTSTSFSIVWTNAFTFERQSSTVEILRFEEIKSSWRWREKAKGKIYIQHAAIKALRLDLSFWMAIALAYLEYLEERDGYHAASDG